MDVSVIIVNYNTRELTINGVRSVFEKTSGVEFEVIVIDNASSDGSREAIPEAFPQIRFIAKEANLGFGPANNIGIQGSQAKYVFLLNSDALLVNNAVKLFFDFMENADHKTVGCCGGNLLNENLTAQAAYGNFPTVRQVIFDQFELRRIFPKSYRAKLAVAVDESHTAVTAVPYVSGAAMFLRRSSLDTAGFFDEHFFLYFEETELCYRLRKLQMAVVIIPGASIIHYVAQSSGGFSLNRLRQFTRSELMFFEKCYGRAIRRLVQVIYLAGTLIRLGLTWDRYYFEKFKILIRP